MKDFEIRKVLRPAGFIVVAIIALLCVRHIWNYYNAEPWTRDGRIRGDVIQVSSDIGGLVTEVLVQDNQYVKKVRYCLKSTLRVRHLMSNRPNLTWQKHDQAWLKLKQVWLKPKPM